MNLPEQPKDTDFESPSLYRDALLAWERVCKAVIDVALHGSQAGPQESELSWDDLHHGPLTATEGFRRHVKEIAKQLDAHMWTGLMAGFAPADMDFGTTNSGDVGGPVSEKP